jgi:hypothetical protein
MHASTTVSRAKNSSSKRLIGSMRGQIARPDERQPTDSAWTKEKVLRVGLDTDLEGFPCSGYLPDDQLDVRSTSPQWCSTTADRLHFDEITLITAQAKLG